MSDGFFLVHRGWHDNRLFRGEFSRGDAWLWLIEQAAWKPARVRIKGETIELRRGELSFAQRFLAEKWGWSKSRVDRFLSELRAESMIETRSKNGANADHAAGQGQCIISICNYSKYQDIQEKARANDETNSGATAGQQRGKEEQGNNTTLAKANDGPSPADFWAYAVAYLGEKRRGMIGKWRKDYGEAETIQAITAAQFAKAMDPVPYIERILRGAKVSTAAGEIW